MKDGFVLLSDLDEQHNKLHKAAFFNPETDYITQTEPTIDNMRIGERRIYYSGKLGYWLYIKVEKRVMTKFQLTVV